MEAHRLELSYDVEGTPLGFSLITYDEYHDPVETIVWPAPKDQSFIEALMAAYRFVNRVERLATGGESLSSP